MFRHVTAALASSALAFTIACSSERSYDGYNEEYLGEGLGAASEFNAIRAIEQGAPAFLSGAIGTVQGLDHDAELTGYDNGDWGDGRQHDYVQLDVYDGNRWAMIGLNFNGGLNHPELQPGTELTFTADDYYTTPETDEVAVDGIGCSSDEMNSFDAPPREISVKVEETNDPEVDAILVTTTYDDGNEAFGAFERIR